MSISSEEVYNNNYFWENSTFHPNIVEEFRRRKNSNNIGIEYSNVDGLNGVYDKKSHMSYKGPMTPWIRVCSNGTGQAKYKGYSKSGFIENKTYDGCILDGSEGFLNSYGIQDVNKPNYNNSSGGNMRIGRECNGRDIYISDSLIHNNAYTYNNNSTTVESPIGLPSPGITSISVTNNKDFLTYATVNFKCYGLAQLEFLMPFFLTPGIYVFVEFGWNLFNTNSLLPLQDINKLKEIITVQQYSDKKFNSNKLLDLYYKSFGNYGLAQGIITNYKFSSKDGIEYNCSFTVTDPQGLFNNNKITKFENSEFGSPKSPKLHIKSVLIDDLDKVFECVSTGKNFLRFIRNVDLKTFSTFYDGKSEDRIFSSRNSKMFRPDYSFKYKYADDTNENNTRRRFPNRKNFEFYSKDQFKVVSDVDENDFDPENKEDVWLQLGFIFEYLNLYLPRIFKIDISNVIVNSHPNMISCSRNVLIPNPIAPKINVTGHDGNNIPVNGRFSYSYGGENEFLKKSFEKSDRVFKQMAIDGGTRDPIFTRENLDDVINYVYYKLHGSKVDASFPFKTDVYLEVKSGDKSKTKMYEAYRYGYLKHIYFNKDKLKQIISDANTVGNILTGILQEINNAVGDYWKLSVCKDEDTNTLTVIDKGLNALETCYQFDIGTDDNFVHDFTFDVNLSDAQATNILFSTGIGGDQDAQSSELSIPSISFYDRFSEPSNPTTGIDSTFNVDSYYKSDASSDTIMNSLNEPNCNLTSLGILQMSFLSVLESSDGSKPITYTYRACLNMNQDMLPILKSLLDDGDFESNSAYANVADNFVVNIKLDGIYGIKVLENFSIRNLPKPYTSENIVFQVNDITHQIENGSWNTNISALVKGVFKSKKIKYISI